MPFFLYNFMIKFNIVGDMMKKLKKKSDVDYGWIIKIIILAFFISVIFTSISETVIPNVNTIIGIIITLIFIGIGVIFDMIGVSVTAADERVFHSMASQKVKGAKTAVKMKKSAEKVSSFCNDVVGDICGIISGSTAAVISINLTKELHLNSLFVTLIVMGIVSSLTIGGKALVKGIAIKRSNKILFRFAKIISVFIER